MNNEILDRAVKLHTSWDDKFTVLSAQKVSLDVIISKLGPRRSDEEAINKVMSLEQVLARKRQ